MRHLPEGMIDIAVINDPVTAANIARVGDAARMPLHVVSMPKSGNSYRYSGFTGTIGAALAASSELLQFRFLSGTKTYALVHKIEVEGVAAIAAATVAGALGFECVPARAWTAAGSGGTRIANTGDNMQTETAIANSQVSDIGISTTGALTAGTKTLDANALGGIQAGVGTAAITAVLASTLIASESMLTASVSGHAPLVLANQEGFVIRTTHVGPASLTYVARFSVAWTEVTAY